MSKSRLYDNGNGGIGLQVVTRADGTPFAIGIFTRNESGSDLVITGVPINSVTTDPAGGTFLLERGIGSKEGPWPQPALARVECGRANLLRNANGWDLTLIDVDLTVGDLLPSPAPPEKPKVNATFSMSALTD